MARRPALRALSGAAGARPIFFDMLHSNNAARVRIWQRCKGDAAQEVETRMIDYPDLATPEFAAVNPLKKVPALVRADGTTVFESDVILRYLEDKYSGHGPVFTPSTAEARQSMNLAMRLHDLYVASPNCTAAGFSHSQGAMYLSTEWHGPARGMDAQTREAKIAEIWKQLSWLEANVAGEDGIAPGGLSLADFTWYPTCIFMEFMLPRVFGWPRIFHEADPFPSIAKWFAAVSDKPEFASVREEIWGYWEKKESEGQFEPIKKLVAETELKWRYP